MARVNIENFEDKELSRIYLADRLAETKQVEALLSDQGVDYAVEVEPFYKIIFGVFRIESSGAAFYVLSGQAHFARRALSAAGLKIGLVDEEGA